MKSKPFVVTLRQYPVEHGVLVDLIVEGIAHWSPLDFRRGHPDTWVAPWQELDVKTVSNARGCALPAKVVGSICARDEFLRQVEILVEKEKFT